MTLTKTAKIWIILLAIPVVLLLGAVITAKIYFTSDRLKALVIPKIEQATNRRVTAGDIALSVFPTLAVSVDSLKISNRAGTPFEHDEFLSLENLTLKVRLMPLIRRQVDVDEIILNRPRVYLEVARNGDKNYSEKRAREKGINAGSTAAAPGGTANTPPGFLLANLEINDGEVSFINRKFDSRIHVAGLNQRAHARAAGGRGDSIVVEGKTDIDKLSYGTLSSWYINDQPLSVSLRLKYTPGTDVLAFEDVTGKLKELPFTLAGSISQLAQETLMMDIVVQSSGAQMDQLLSLVPPEMLKKARGLQSSGTVGFSAAIKGPSSETTDPATRASFTVTGGKIQYASLPKSISNVTLSGSFEKPSAPIEATGIGTFTIDKFSASLGTSSLAGKMRMTNFKDPSVSAAFDGTVNLAEVRDYYPLEEGTELGGMLKANITLDGKARTPEAIRAGGSVQLQDVTVKSKGSSQPVQGLTGTITFNNQAIESKQLALKIGESDMNMAFTLRNYLGLLPVGDTAAAAVARGGAKPAATLKLTSHQLRTADLTGSPGKDQASAGTAGRGMPKGGGMLPGFDVAADVSVDKLVTEKFTFNNARGSLTASGGVVTLKNFSVNAFQGSITTRGMLDLRNELKRPFDLDLAIDGVESNALLPKFTSFGNFLYGKLTMNTKLRGDLNDTLGLNPGTMAGDGNVKIVDGKLAAFPLVEKLSSFTGLPELREVNFKDWANAFSIAGGRVNVKGLKVNAGQTDFLMEGSQGFDGTLAYALTVKLPAEVSGRLNLQGVGGELLQYMKDKDGRLSLAFQVGGTASNPTLRLDLQAQQETARRALGQKGTEAKQKIEDELKKKAEEGLKKLFKRPL